MLRRLSKLLRWYLMASGLLANLLLGGAATLVAVVGFDDLRAAARDGLPGLRRVVSVPLARVEAWRASRMARESGLRAAGDAGTAGMIDVPLGAGLGTGRVLQVGPGRRFISPGAAAAVAAPGDIIEIDAGRYGGESVLWRTDDLVIRGVGGLAHIDGTGVALVQEKALWLIQARNVRVERIEFSNARSRDRNGAGIRAEGDRLHVVACAFHDNETGLLSNPIIDGSLRIEYSEFARNGHADGQAHQIYVNPLAEFVLRFSYIHDSLVGSAVKSRAAVSRIAYNRIVDGIDGSSNYTLDFADGGEAYVVGNILEQGPLSGNRAIIAFATEAGRDRSRALFVVHNTLVNDRHAGVFLRNHAVTVARLYNNLLLGAGAPFSGPVLAVGNAVVRDGWAGWFDASLDGVEGSTANRVLRGQAVRDRAGLDYRLRPDSPAIAAAVALDDSPELDITPRFEYVHPLASRARPEAEAIAAGALAAE